MEQADYYLLITRYLARQTSSEENERLATWVTESPDHEQLFEQLKMVWQHSAPPPAPAETTAALHRVKARLHLQAPAPHPARPPRPKHTFQLLALALVVVLAAAGTLYLHRPLAAPVTYQLHRTAAGQQQTIRLADGSLVTLAPQSRLRYPQPFAGTYRDVYLEGEAFFEVSKDARRPFRVHSGSWTTQVLGTKFNVSAFRGAAETAVSVVEGRVRVRDAQTSYLLTPGQQLRAERPTGRVYRQAFNRAQVEAWKSNKLIFQNEKLADVAGRIERLYGVKLVFADSATANVRLWATFHNEPLPAVLEALQFAGSITYRREEQTIYVKQEVRKPPPE